MKKMTALLLAMAMVFSLASCGNNNQSGGSNAGGSTTGGGSNAGGSATGDAYANLDKVELIGADSTGKGAAGQIFGELVASKVAEITGGQLTIDYHPNGDLGGDADLLRQMQSNDIQIVVCQTAPIVSFVTDMAVFDLPMVFSRYDGDTIDAVLNGADSAFRAQLAQSYEASGYHLLGFLQNGTYRLTSANTNLTDLASFRGLKIRTMENSNHMDFWTAIGAEPTPLAFSELYFALQSGTVNAEENAADTIVGNSFNEVQDYLACTNHILYANQICINKDAYDELDPAYQAALDQAVSEALAEMRPQLSQIDEDNKQALVDAGMTLIEYENAFYDEILALDTVQALYEKIDGQINGLGTTLQEALEAAAA